MLHDAVLIVSAWFLLIPTVLMAGFLASLLVGAVVGAYNAGKAYLKVCVELYKNSFHKPHDPEV